MKDLIVGIIVGIILCIIGVINMKGNISTLKRHHRKRVSEEDKPIMGKLVGIGTVAMGCSMLIFGVLSFISQKLQIQVLTLVGTIILIIGFVFGIILMLYAIIKYNKGLF